MFDKKAWNKKYNKEYYKRNKERCLAKDHKWQEEHKEQKRKVSRSSHLKRKYNLTPAEFERMVALQDNKCAVCGDMFTGMPYVDHDHITGRVRGLLCIHCNTMIGHARDNSNILLNGIRYLEVNRTYKNE